MGNVVGSSPEELHGMLQLEGHDIVHDAMDEVDEWGVAPEHGGVKVAVAADQNDFASR